MSSSVAAKQVATKAFDYIIVGGGSAGCVLANRLSSLPNTTVALIESGPTDASPLVKLPLGVAVLVPFSRKYNWQFSSVPQKHLNGRSIFQPRGKGMGGSSSINAMVYIRGHPVDYDTWESLGNKGWSYKDILPCFKLLENNSRGANAYHGDKGELSVTDLHMVTEKVKAFLEAGKELGIPYNEDFNGADQEGIGHYQSTRHNGRRCNSAAAFLDPIRSRPNLTVITNMHTTRLLMDGKKAVGIEVAKWYDRNATTRLVAGNGVILAAGAFGSPQILQLSGIGPRKHLESLGIPVVADLPGVGANLQDHLDTPVNMMTKVNEYPYGAHPANLIRQTNELVKYLQGEDNSMFNSNLAEAGAFWKSSKTLPAPDHQIHTGPHLFADHGRKLLLGYGMTIHDCVLRPRSRGTVMVASKDPFAAPLIDPNYLAHPQDMEDQMTGVRMLGRFVQSNAFKHYNWYNCTLPNDGKDMTDTQIKEYVRAKSSTVYHPVGTCKMGPASDVNAVVDPDTLKVYGVDNLHVVDASVMPTLIGGNTNKPTMVIAQKAAEAIMRQHVTLDVGNERTAEAAM